ncbi:four helix bundle protein [Pendulispora brunnea]|uniref:Four helix bundle protein n=1 Tax=Pendulispora brunnea TaxID=2905690 RepID=A0ABZ2KJ09_9BACT
MTDQNTNPRSVLSHHSLVAYQVAVEFLVAVKAANIRDAKLRDEAMRSAKSVCLNTAEGAGRVTRADKARAFAIARGEAIEAVAAVEIAGVVGDVDEEAVRRCVGLAQRVVGLLTRLVR